MRAFDAHRRGFRLGIVLMVVAGTLIAGSPASACSCAQPDLATWLPEADGAFVGRWVDRTEIGDGTAAVTFDVERVLKGSFGPTAIIRTNAQGSACGLERLGRSRMGLLLQLDADGVWSSGLCSMVPPAQLLAVGDATPPDPDLAAVSAGWSLGGKGLVGALVAAGLALFALLVFLVVRRRASRPESSDVT
jgi:hypothetical protein